jgi:putative intracellular protease/amidase
LWDLANDATSIALIEAAERAGKPLGLVCHAPGALIKASAADGRPLVAGRKVTGFSNSEEAAVGLTTVVPFLIEGEFERLGARYEKGADWHPYVVTDGRLVTGQNPASSQSAAKALLALLS